MCVCVCVCVCGFPVLFLPEMVNKVECKTHSVHKYYEIRELFSRVNIIQY